MAEVGKIRNRPTTTGLANRGPGRHPFRVDAMQAKKRLGLQFRARRKQRGLNSQRELADAMESAGYEISESTIQIIESGRRTVSSQTYAMLEEFFGLPIGSAEQILRGEIRSFPNGDVTPEDGGDETYTHGEQSFTKAELAVLARALGPKAFMDWALRDGEDSADASGM